LEEGYWVKSIANQIQLHSSYILTNLFHFLLISYGKKLYLLQVIYILIEQKFNFYEWHSWEKEEDPNKSRKL